MRKPRLAVWVAILVACAWLLADAWAPASAGDAKRKAKPKKSVAAAVERATPHEAAPDPAAHEGEAHEADHADDEHDADEHDADEHHDASAQGGHEPLFVTPPHSPTEVKVGLYLVAVTRVDPPAEPYPTFEAEVFLDMVWNDPRLAFDPEKVGTKKEVFLEHEAELELERIWWPDVEFENGQGERDIEGRELVITSDGTVEYSERFHGKFTFDPDLRKFPFDQQLFELHIDSFAWDERSLVFVPYAEKTGYDESIHTQEWKIVGVTKEVLSKKEVRSAHAFSTVALKVEAQRESGYYLWKIIAPVLIIVLFNWTTFWMPGELATTRMERAFIALLTVVAFHQIVAANLPRISYLTFMDGAVFVAFASVGLTMVSIMLAQRYESLGRPDVVLRMDKQARWMFPAIFIVALVALWITYH
jgi:hypothetical protein